MNPRAGADLNGPWPHLYYFLPGHLPPDWGRYTGFDYHHDVSSLQWVVVGRLETGGLEPITQSPTPGQAEGIALRFWREHRLYRMGLIAALEYQKRYPNG